MELTEFLNARIAEDAERGRSLVMQWHDVGNTCQSCGTDGKRLIGECEVKRQMIELAKGWDESLRDDYWGESEKSWGPDIDLSSAAGMLLRLLAFPYADHADYDNNWHPQA